MPNSFSMRRIYLPSICDPLVISKLILIFPTYIFHQGFILSYYIAIEFHQLLIIFCNIIPYHFPFIFHAAHRFPIHLQPDRYLQAVCNSFSIHFPSGIHTFPIIFKFLFITCQKLQWISEDCLIYFPSGAAIPHPFPTRSLFPSYFW